MGLHHLVYIVQSEAKARDAAFAVVFVDGSPSELVEDDVLVVLGDANAVVAHLKHVVFVCGMRGDLDLNGIGLGVFDGVIDQVGDGLGEILLISHHMLCQQVDGKVDGLLRLGLGLLYEIIDDGHEGYTLLTKWPKGEPNPYGKYFIGHSYLADVGGGVMNVTFEPRCRNNWHVHHKQVQVLICVAGRGWYQEWGKEAVEMTPGTVIAIPAEAKHWHGAAKDSWFQHLTYHKDVLEGASNEWLEPVTDEVYDKLK